MKKASKKKTQAKAPVETPKPASKPKAATPKPAKPAAKPTAKPKPAKTNPVKATPDVRWTPEGRALLNGRLRPQPGDPKDAVMTASLAWAALRERNALFADVRSFPLGIPAPLDKTTATLLQHFASKTPPTKLEPRSEVLRAHLLSNGRYGDPLSRWLAFFWLYQGGLALLTGIDGARLDLFAQISARERFVVKKGQTEGTGTFEHQICVLALAPPGSADKAIASPYDQPTLSVKVPRPNAPEESSTQTLELLGEAVVDWNAVRAAMLEMSDADYGRVVAARPKVDVGGVLPELEALVARNAPGLGDHVPAHETRRHSHQVLWACAKDTETAAAATQEILSTLRALGFDPDSYRAEWARTDPLATKAAAVWQWLLQTEAYRLLPNLEDPALALTFARVLQSSAHVWARMAFDLVERLGRGAAPILEMALPHLARYRDEKKIVGAALKSVTH